jgi:putative oxygen-independent coproporphyrinogen III oxidase
VHGTVHRTSKHNCRARENSFVSSVARFGVYVHIPFCAARCDYCDFATWTDRSHLIDRYVQACVDEVVRRRVDGMPRATSVFFGGGTPSLIAADQLVRILDAIDREDDAEVTVECNPDSVDAEKLGAYRRSGVNRLSFGVQSMSPHVLAALGRTHDPANVTRAIALARDAGFERINADLIYGTPQETSDDWRRSLDGALALEVGHVSAYALTVEPGTPLGRRVAAGAAATPDDDVQADDYLVADRLLTDAGLEWYEISNWARPGEECRHNLLYWTQGDYAGIGCAAHGHTDGRRSWNVRTPERYISAVAQGTTTEAGHEVLDDPARAEEALTLGLRTRWGVPVAGVPALTVNELVEGGVLTISDERAVLTRRGRLLASDVSARLALSAAATAGTR